jgi:hypothetical protein
MSKFPILDTSSASLDRPVGSPDGSERAVLRVRVNTTTVGMLDFFGSHISFDRYYLSQNDLPPFPKSPIA